jgi:hypothetical protein
MWYAIMIQDHLYESPILDVQRRFRVRCQHPNSHLPTLLTVKNCAPSPCDANLFFFGRALGQVYLQQNKKKTRAEGNSCHA